MGAVRLGDGMRVVGDGGWLAWLSCGGVRGYTGVVRAWWCGGRSVCRGVGGGPGSRCAELEFVVGLRLAWH